MERSPSRLSFSNDKEQEVKSEAFQSDSRTPSESSVKTSPSRGDLEHEQYSTEKDDSSGNTSPPLKIEVDDDIAQKEESGEAEEQEEAGKESIEKEEPQTLSPPLSAEVSEDQEEEKEAKSAELLDDFAPVHLNTATDVSSRDTAIGDTPPKPESAMPVFSTLNDKAAPAPAHARDHMDLSDTKMLEPDSPQLPGKSILPSAPSWADTPPSPKKGDEDIEPGISCASAVTPSTKPEPIAPTAQPRTYGRKHARGRRRIPSGSGVRRQPSLETEKERDCKTKEESTSEPSAQEGSSQQRHRRYRKPEGLESMPRRGGLRRVTLRERFRRIQQLKASGTSEQEEREDRLQRLQQEAETKEHWAHENCAIWTRGVVMVAGRLFGLKEAAKSSAQMSCYKCQTVGASLSCCWRGCSNKYHYVCAKEIGCTFHEDDFSIKCPKHEDL
uniref:PHD-type domain-containing protein n=1 Tax=Knipowitschia caucasica TaxID=637954 RepID=A0AAV2KLS0_KNICA